MYFSNDNKNVDQGHRQEFDKQAILQKSRSQREERRLNKDQNEKSILIQSKMRSYLAKKALQKSLVVEEQIPKNTQGVATLLSQPKILPEQKTMILQKAFDKILHKVNWYLRLTDWLYVGNEQVQIMQVTCEALITILSHSEKVQNEFLENTTFLVVQNALKLESPVQYELLQNLPLLTLLKSQSADKLDFQKQKWNLTERFEVTSNLLLLKTNLEPALLDFLLEHNLTKVTLPLNFLDSVHAWLKSQEKVLSQFELSMGSVRRLETVYQFLNRVSVNNNNSEEDVDMKSENGNTKNQDLVRADCISLATSLLTTLLQRARDYSKKDIMVGVNMLAEQYVLSLDLQQLSSHGVAELQSQCRLVCAIMQLSDILKRENAQNTISQLEKQIIYRSDYLIRLYTVLANLHLAKNLDEIKYQQEISLFCNILNQRMILIDDKEFLGEKSQFGRDFLSKDQLIICCEMLNKLAYRVFQTEQSMSFFDGFFLDNLKQGLQRLVIRDLRLKLFPSDFWVADEYIQLRLQNRTMSQVAQAVSQTILQNCPQCYPFEVRAKYFTYMIDEIKRQINYDLYHGGQQIDVRREYILEDAMEQIIGKNISMQSNFRIRFVDENGMYEDGIDGGGLLKEFLTKITERIFDPQFGFFKESDSRQLYPNNITVVQYDQQTCAKMFDFFGQIIGKALFDGCLLKCNFARFFLNKLVNKSNQVDDLKALDAQLYENLMKIKYYQGENVEDMGLTMSISEELLGQYKEIPLIPGGQNIPVNNETKVLYVAHYANYMMSQRTQFQTHAFVSGLKKVIDQECLSVFFPDEIQLLISGGLNEIDIVDLRTHTKYNNWTREDEPYLNEFWAFVEQMPNDQKEKLLSFATGTDRPPLLGFKYLFPNFCIAKLTQGPPGQQQQQNQVINERRFPTSSTCANLLKLPFFGNTQQGIAQMKSTLHEAINNAQGFYQA